MVTVRMAGYNERGSSGLLTPQEPVTLRTCVCARVQDVLRQVMYLVWDERSPRALLAQADSFADLMHEGSLS